MENSVQNKNWLSLSEEGKEMAKREYQNSTSEDAKRILENLYGKENLVRFSYDNIAEKLFKFKTYYIVSPKCRKPIDASKYYQDYKSEFLFVSEKQAEKVMAYNKLLNAAKLANEGKVLTSGYKITLDAEGRYGQVVKADYPSCDPLFIAPEVAIQVMRELGDEIIVTALSNDY